MDLSQYLRAIISQRLVRGMNGQRVAAVEVMLNTPRIAELIQRGDVSKVKESFIDSSEQGKFGWVIDPKGNKVELWQPPAGM